MRFVLETISPAKAKKFLAKNTSNRRVRATWVQKLTRMILDGSWIITHQGIAIDTDGVLRDGQHRLMAITKANKSVKMWVAYDVATDIVLGIDQCGVRNVADISGPLVGADDKLTNDEVATARQM